MLGLYETLTQGGRSCTLLDKFSLDEGWFGRICDPGTVLGRLLPEASAKLGVKGGVPVAIGTKDMAAGQARRARSNPRSRSSASRDFPCGEGRHELLLPHRLEGTWAPGGAHRGNGRVRRRPRPHERAGRDRSTASQSTHACEHDPLT